MPDCHCPYPGYDHVIYEVFQDCIYTTWEYIGFAVGMSSIAFWICCQAPQFIKNWRRGEAEALSLWFLTEWLLGDSTNLAGCLLTHTLPTQTYTAMLFVVMDVVILTQYAVLWLKNRRHHRRAAQSLLRPDESSIADSEEEGSDSGSGGGLRASADAAHIGANPLAAAAPSSAAPANGEAPSSSTSSGVNESQPLMADARQDRVYTTPARPMGVPASRRVSLPDSEAMSTGTGTTYEDTPGSSSVKNARSAMPGQGLPASPPTTVMERGFGGDEEPSPVPIGAAPAPSAGVHRPAASRSPRDAGPGQKLYAMFFPLLSMLSFAAWVYSTPAPAHTHGLRGRVLLSETVQSTGEWMWQWQGVGANRGPYSLFTPGYSAMVQPVHGSDDGWKRVWVPSTTSGNVSIPRRELHLNLCELDHPVSETADTVGIVLGYVSSTLYLTSRIPQVVRNFRRKTVEGLSWMMFFCAFMGNLTSLSAILMRADTAKEWISEAPFIPGMAGTLAFDLLIVIQYAVYTRRAKKRRETRRQLRERLKREHNPKQYLLTDTPKINPHARRGVHDIVESPPEPGRWRIDEEQECQH